MKNNPYLFIKETKGQAKSESRCLLREAAEAFFREEKIPEEEILRTSLGKPYFPSGNIYLSMTHTGNLFAAVFSIYPVGIDAEPAEIRKEGVALRFFSEEERKYPFSQVWTAKEAVAKLDGRGLSVIGKVRVEENFAFLEEKKYLLERQRVGEYLLTIALLSFEKESKQRKLPNNKK